jgi:hypothetical protein
LFSDSNSSCNKYSFTDARSLLEGWEILSLPSFLWTKKKTITELEEKDDKEETEMVDNSTTASNNTLDTMLLRLNVMLCRGGAGGGGPCTEYEPLDRYSVASRDCQRNLLKSLHLDITHNGLEGIQNVDAYIELVDMASTSTNAFFRRI